MAEYIGKSALIGWTLSRIYQKDENNMVYEVRKIEDFPAADVAPVKHGRWIYQGQKVIEETFPTYCCSSCFFLIPGNWRTNCRYCPNCGAKMDGGET